jgi:hypothetical protein
LEICQIGIKIPFHTFDESREGSHDFIQPRNIETVQGNQSLRFSILNQKANYLRAMDHNIIGDFPQTEPMLFSYPRNIAARGTNIFPEYGENFWDVAWLGFS